jgi:hypothetical protein
MVAEELGRFWKKLEKELGLDWTVANSEAYFERLAWELLIRKPELKLGITLETGVPIGLSLEELQTHLHILAATGAGKSRLLIQIFNELRKQEASLILIDAAKGDTFSLALDYCIRDRVPVWTFSPHPERNS